MHKSIIPFIFLAGFMVLSVYSLGWRAINLENVPLGHRPSELFLLGDWVHYEHVARPVHLFRNTAAGREP